VCARTHDSTATAPPGPSPQVLNAQPSRAPHRRHSLRLRARTRGPPARARQGGECGAPPRAEREPCRAPSVHGHLGCCGLRFPRASRRRELYLRARRARTGRRARSTPAGTLARACSGAVGAWAVPPPRCSARNRGLVIWLLAAVGGAALEPRWLESAWPLAAGGWAFRRPRRRAPRRWAQCRRPAARRGWRSGARRGCRT